MRAYCGQYVAVLNSRRILYLPTCLMVEMMVALHGELHGDAASHPDPNRAVNAVAPGLDAFILALANTRQAYQDERIRFFIGDWKDDRHTVRDVSLALLDRLRTLAAPAGPVQRRYLQERIDALSDESHRLIDTLDCQADGGRMRRTANACCYFHSSSPMGWRQVMARTLMVLHQQAGYPDDDACLMLLCYGRIRRSMEEEIAAIEEKNPSARPFDSRRLAVVSDNDFPMSCPNCTRMADACRRGARSGSDTVTVARPRETGVARLRPDTRPGGSRRRVGARRTTRSSLPVSPYSFYRK